MLKISELIKNIIIIIIIIVITIIIILFFYNTLLHIYTKEINIKVTKIIITLIHRKTKGNNEQRKSKKRKRRLIFTEEL